MTYELNGITVQTVGMNNGDWQVRIRGTECQIVDEQGRCRHMSQGHINTAIALACRLDDMLFQSDPVCDAAMKKLAEDFMAGE